MSVNLQWPPAKLAMEREGAIIEGSNKLCPKTFSHTTWIRTGVVLGMLGMQFLGYSMREDTDVEMTPQANIFRGETRDETAFTSMLLSFYPLQRQGTTILSVIGPLALSDDPPVESRIPNGEAGTSGATTSLLDASAVPGILMDYDDSIEADQ